MIQAEFDQAKRSLKHFSNSVEHETYPSAGILTFISRINTTSEY